MTLSVLRTEPAGEIPRVVEGPAPSDGGGRGIRTRGVCAASVPRAEIPSEVEGPAPSNGGGRGIRTPGTVSRTVVFKTTRFNRSRIPPQFEAFPFATACIVFLPF